MSAHRRHARRHPVGSYTSVRGRSGSLSRRRGTLREIGRLDFGLDPLLTEAMDDPGEVFTEHLAELALYLTLDELLYDGNRVEGAVDVDVLQRVRLEYERDPFLARDDKHDVRVELEVRET